MKKHAIILGAVLLSFLSALGYAQAPVPFVNLPLVPDATAPGGADFTLTVNGTGFVSNSVVNWNGNALATQYVSGSQLTATVPATDIATPSTGWVTVVNPAPGGGTSNTAFFTVTANTGNFVAFTPMPSIGVGLQPQSVAVADFNGDGKLDLAVANLGAYGSSTVSILLGDGAGNFTLASSVIILDYLQSVAVGDFNDDGKPDLVIAGNGSGRVYILLGDGTGNFTLASSTATGGYPTSVTVGDFNEDGKLDVAACNEVSNTVAVLLGDGQGNLTLASSSAVGGLPYSVAVGDFNGDGHLDLATANETSNTASILLGDGTGNFTPASSPQAGRNPISVGVGDFNGDGKLDLAVVDPWGCGTCTSGNLSILLGNGGGNFTLHSSPTTDGWQSWSVALADINGDGKLDLAVPSEGSGTVSVLLGDGTGHFTLAGLPPAGNFPSSVVAGDFNGDGMMDLAVTDAASDSVSILLQVPAVVAVALSPTSLTFGTQLIGTSSGPQPVTLTNAGNTLLNIGKIAANNLNFSQTNNCPSTLQPSGQCTINVIFSPAKIGGPKGTVTIKDNAPTSPQTVALSGIGTVVTLLPSSLNFGNQTVGTTSQPQTVTLTNYGTQALSIQGIHVTGRAAGDFAQTNTCGTSLPAAGSCTISVTFTPNGEGSTTATLDLSDNGGGSPQTVVLSGTGS